MGPPVRILHLHSTFTLGGKEARAVRLMNAFGGAAAHVVLSAMPGALAARDAIDRDVRADFPADHPSLTGRPSWRRYAELARYMRGFDLVLSYNWGAMDGVMARRLFAARMALPPLVHHEDGFNQDELVRQKKVRVLFRRAALHAAKALVVPSRTLETIARDTWKQPSARVRRIPNGIRLPESSVEPIPGFERPAAGCVIGTVAGLRPVKNLPLLVRAFAAAAPADALLVILGEGPERAAIIAEAERCGVAARLAMPGFIRDPARSMGLFDIFALSSHSEQFPIALAEAMAVGLPVVAPAVGDVSEMVAPENLAFIMAAGDENALADALRRMVAAGPDRSQIGLANMRRARMDFSEDAMIAAYRVLYSEAIGNVAALA